jgi:hypothetical protein
MTLAYSSPAGKKGRSAKHSDLHIGPDLLEISKTETPV